MFSLLTTTYSINFLIIQFLCHVRLIKVWKLILLVQLILTVIATLLLPLQTHSKLFQQHHVICTLSASIQQGMQNLSEEYLCQDIDYLKLVPMLSLSIPINSYWLTNNLHIISLKYLCLLVSCCQLQLAF